MRITRDSRLLQRTSNGKGSCAEAHDFPTRKRTREPREDIEAHLIGQHRGVEQRGLATGPRKDTAQRTAQLHQPEAQTFTMGMSMHPTRLPRSRSVSEFV